MSVSPQPYPTLTQNPNPHPNPITAGLTKDWRSRKLPQMVIDVFDKFKCEQVPRYSQLS